jgi:hypothetical protein
LDTTGFEVKVEEEQSADDETGHTTEIIGAICFDQGSITAAEVNHP